MKNNKFEELKQLKPFPFKGVNTEVSKNQEEYGTLPAFDVGGKNGFVVSCWKLSFLQRIYLLFVGKIWHTQFNFGNPLQPISKSIRDKYYLYDAKTKEIIDFLE